MLWLQLEPTHITTEGKSILLLKYCCLTKKNFIVICSYFQYDKDKVFNASTTTQLLFNMCINQKNNQNIKFDEPDFMEVVSSTQALSWVFDFLEDYGFIKIQSDVDYRRNRQDLLKQLWTWVHMRDRSTALEHVFMNSTRPKGMHSWIYLVAMQDQKYIKNINELDYQQINNVSNYFI